MENSFLKSANPPKILSDEEQFKIMADSTPAMIWISGSDKLCYFFNRAWLHFTGRTMEEESGNGWAKGIHPDDYERVLAIYHAGFDNRVAFKMEYRLQHRDGGYRWLLNNGVPHYDDKGRFAGYIGSCIDIQEMKDMEHKKDEFISAVSHEMKTPLTTMKVYVELLDELLQAKDDSEEGMFVTQIKKQINKFSALIKDLNQLAKIQSDTLIYKKTTFDFNLLIREAVTDFKSLYPAFTHEIELKGDISKEVSGDPDHLKQVVIQLLHNSVKFSPGKDKLIVEIIEKQTEIQVSVTDFGLGISPKYYDAVFQLFYRIPQNDHLTFPGLGTGLFKAAEIIKNHGGRISVESTEGKHTTFSFVIPA